MKLPNLSENRMLDMPMKPAGRKVIGKKKDSIAIVTLFKASTQIELCSCLLKKGLKLGPVGFEPTTNGL